MAVSPRRTTVKEVPLKGKPDCPGAAVNVVGEASAWKGTVKDRLEISSEVEKVWVAEAPGKVAPLSSRLTVSTAGMASPVAVLTVLWKLAW